MIYVCLNVSCPEVEEATATVSDDDDPPVCPRCETRMTPEERLLYSAERTGFDEYGSLG